MRLRNKILIAAGFITLIACSLLGGFAYLLLHRTQGLYFDSAGAQIHYTVEGNGPPVILVHGVGANADLNWRRPGVTRMLAKEFRVIAFDLRGHGLSDKPRDPEQYGIQMVNDIVRLMDHLKISQAHIAGYSLGGFLALKAISLYPDRFLSAAICAAGWKNPDDPSPIPSPYRAPEMSEAQKVNLASVFAFAQSKSLFHRIRSRIGDYLMDPYAKKSLKKGYLDLAVFLPALKQNQVPMLCVIGDRDGFLYLARELVKVASNIEGHEIRKANHFTLPLNHAFKTCLKDFFSRHNKD